MKIFSAFFLILLVSGLNSTSSSAQDINNSCIGSTNSTANLCVKRDSTSNISANGLTLGGATLGSNILAITGVTSINGGVNSSTVPGAVLGVNGPIGITGGVITIYDTSGSGGWRTNITSDGTSGTKISNQDGKPVTLAIGATTALTADTTGGLIAPNLATSCSGKPTGTLWNNAGVLNVCP